MTCPFKEELKKGMAIESEHSKNKNVQKKIATDHISENNCYYTKGLIPMEKRLKNQNKINSDLELPEID
jgi:hypothetical protein